MESEVRNECLSLDIKRWDEDFFETWKKDEGEVHWIGTKGKTEAHDSSDMRSQAPDGGITCWEQQGDIRSYNWGVEEQKWDL